MTSNMNYGATAAGELTPNPNRSSTPRLTPTPQDVDALGQLETHISLILQLLFGGILTALGSSSAGKHGLAITVLATANTVNAGLIALFNNTGMPERFWNDWNEFEDVEMFVKELIETGLVDTDKKEEVIAGCYVRFQAAKMTVRRNKPASYDATVKEEKKGK
ncbi:hypothetical protein DID88_008752 [Monilinia fructigena]|uniref:SMODS and SLOG-associating 2TM effector domain-containing protein n=1 Tax=Monilinia fructigena TaxID=38457 RepID=A0A395JBC2_9HELO|nr:hypothetical protein DID88_008752 [Monilinia fructigena]